jgi:hypothetical protein
MPDSPQEELPEEHSSSGRRHRHRRKRRSHKKLWRKIIIVVLFVLACVGAFYAWHIMIQDPVPRHSSAVRRPI